MPYPDDRYPNDPGFPRPQSTKTTKENDLMDRDWYEVICSYIEDAASAAMPPLPATQIYRGNASSQPVATAIIQITDTGAEATVDHSAGTSPRMVNVVYVASPGALVAANTVPIGTLGIIYTP